MVIRALIDQPKRIDTPLGTLGQFGSIFAPKGKGLTDAQSLTKLKVGISGKYGSSYIGIKAILYANKIDESKVNLVEIGYTQVLADAGYTCGLSGVWNLGDNATPRPSNRPKSSSGGTGSASTATSSAARSSTVSSSSSSGVAATGRSGRA